MNKVRRQALKEILTKLEDIKEDILELRDEEQEYYDNIPESLQGGKKALGAENTISNMDEAIDSLEEAARAVDEAEAP